MGNLVICELPFVPLRVEKKKKKVSLEIRKKNFTSMLIPGEQNAWFEWNVFSMLFFLFVFARKIS